MAQKYSHPVALERMAEKLCPECGWAAEDHTGWGRSDCSLTDTGVAQRIAQYEADQRAAPVEAATGRQPRERPVLCLRCMRSTWEVSAVCKDCQRKTR